MTDTGIVGTVHGVVRKTLTVVLMCVCQVFGVEDQQALSRVGCGDPQRDSRFVVPVAFGICPQWLRLVQWVV